MTSFQEAIQIVFHLLQHMLTHNVLLLTDATGVSLEASTIDYFSEVKCADGDVSLSGL